MKLEEFFRMNPRVAIAFSGGTDSVYLLHEAVRSGADVKAYCVRSVFQPDFETEDALRFAHTIGCDLRLIDVDVLSDERITYNPENRCYYCKLLIMTAIKKAAGEEGYDIVCDGTNASDDLSDRPGYRALQELGIRSPLLECGYTKADIRVASREAGLETWNKPAYACLATRIAYGETITAEKLSVTEKAEMVLRDMGFTDLRVRMRGSSALVQIREEQHALAKEKAGEIRSALRGLYDSVEIDENPRPGNGSVSDLY